MENTNITIRPSDLDAVKPKFTQLINDPAVFAREASFACQLMNSNPYLAKGSKESLQMAVLNVAQLQLSLNPALKLAYLVPRWSKKTGGVEVSLEASYQGLVKLLTDCGTVKQVDARIIWEGDDIDIDLAYPEKVRKHQPYALTGKPKGEMRGVYSLATLHDGSKSIEIMSREEVYAVRERSESFRKSKEGVTSIWVTDEAEMCRKTVIRRHFKYLPKSGNVERVAEAIKMEEADYEITATQIGKIEQLLITAEIREDAKDRIEKELATMSSAQAAECISFLSECQPKNSLQLVTEELNATAGR